MLAHPRVPVLDSDAGTLRLGADDGAVLVGDSLVSSTLAQPPLLVLGRLGLLVEFDLLGAALPDTDGRPDFAVLGGVLASMERTALGETEPSMLGNALGALLIIGEALVGSVEPAVSTILAFAPKPRFPVLVVAGSDFRK